MPIKKRLIDGSLTKKGFIKDVKHDHIHYMYVNLKTGAPSPIRTIMSHNNNEISGRLLTKMSNQLHLSRDDFQKFVECHIDRTQYNEMMIKKGVIV